MSTNQEKGWFTAPTKGIGTARPIWWKGWLVVSLTLGAVFVAIRHLRGVPLAVALSVIVIGFLIICFSKTEGGWKLRW